MRVRRVFLAGLAGTGFTSLLALLLNVPLQPILYPAFLLLAPGGIVGSVLLKVSRLSSPVPALVLNAALYSAVAYLVFYRLKYYLSARRTVIVAIVVVLLACLACVPSLSPLWPQRMSELDDKEKVLNEGLQVGGSDLTPGFLTWPGYRFIRIRGKDGGDCSAEVRPQDRCETGGRVLLARVDTEAQQFPCSYRIQGVLLIDRQGKLNQRYIARSPLCP